MPAVLTTKMVEKAIRDPEVCDLSDSRVPGLVIRSKPVGATWMVRVNHKKHTLGSAKDITLDNARDLAREIIARVKSGFIVDPHFVQRQKVALGIVEDGAPAPSKIVRAPVTWTWEEALEAYLAETHRALRPKTAQNYRSILVNKAVTAEMAGRFVAEVDRRTVATMIHGIHQAGKEATAENVTTQFRLMWDFLARDAQKAASGIEENIMRPLQKAGRSRGYGKLTRTPALEVCGTIVAACRLGVFDPLICRALEVLVLTAQRRLTIASIATKDIDVKGGLWVIPGDSIKGDQPHHLPMLPRVTDILSAAGGGTWLFPQMRPRKVGMEVSHVHESTLTHNMSDLGLDASPHDMRRSFTTVAVDAGLPEIYASYVLDHREGRKSVTSVHYNRALYIPEKRAVLEAWEKALEPYIAMAIAQMDVAAERAKLVDKRKAKARYARDGKRPKRVTVGKELRDKRKADMAIEAAEWKRRADELIEIDRVLDDVVERRISDDEARHALRLDTNADLAVSLVRRGKDASKRPDLLQAETNSVLGRLGIKLQDGPVQHDPALMAKVMEAMQQQVEAIIKAQQG